MKVNCWDKCFLCLTNFGSTSSSSSSCGGKKSTGRRRQMELNERPNLSVLIKYLLGDQNDSLLQRIRRLQEPNSTSCSEGLIKFCDNCQDSARQISHLQMELEVIQMKIVDILWSMRKTVIGNASCHHDGTSGMSFEEFTEERQEVLDTLHAFQAAVFEKSKKSIHVPLVYIERFTGCNQKANRAVISPAEKDKLNLVKTEPQADSLDEILSNFGDDHVSFDYDHEPDHPTTPNEGDDPQEEGMDTKNDVWTPQSTGRSLAPLAPPLPEFDLLARGQQPPQKLQKRGRPRKNLLTPSSQPDANLNPIIKEETTDCTRKSRSAAETAAKRPRKVAKRARKMKQVEKKRKSTPASSSSSSKVSKKTKKQSGTRKVFVCEICPYKTRRTFQFEHHLSQHETPEVVNHICPHCTNPPRQFSQKQSFDYHMDSHSGLNKMACDICGTLIDPNVILEHLRGHPEVEKVFQCSCCSCHCGTREGYLKHIGYHGAAALVCDVCSKKFRNRKRMLHHMHNEHNLLKKIKCDVGNCNKEFFELKILTAHKKLHMETFVCSECNLQFRSARHLLGHQVREHSKEKPFRCSECPETFIDQSTLQRHLINAHGAAKLKCPYCPKEFVCQGSLISHINLHEGNSFPCDKCDKAFGYRAALKRHQNVHNTREDFVCEECGKAFRYELSLRAHIKIHNGDKKHKCAYCSKGFVNRQNLICHERIHTGEKPYICEACGKDFNQRSSLNLHMRTQHIII